MQAKGDVAGVDGHRVADNGSSERKDGGLVLHGEVHDDVQEAQHGAATGHDVPIERQQFLAEFHGELVDALAGLVDAGLRRVVEDVVLPGGRGRLGEGLVRLLLLPLDHIEVGGQRGQDLGHADAVHAQVLEQRRQGGQGVGLADLLQLAEEHQHALVGGLVQRLGELLDIQADGTGEFLGLLEEHHDEPREC